MIVKSKNKTSSVDLNQKQVAEWDSNDCGFCILCSTPFSIFRNRKHHCRKCGRLICESCSSRRMKLDTNAAVSPHSKNTDQPQRVCDPCYLMLTKKEEQKIEYVFKRDKNVELLMTSSIISESLIDVYFLDGSYKTVCYDDATTIAEIASSICFSVKIALFEVLQDINDPRQFQLLKPSETVSELVSKWKIAKLKYCKIVLPLYDLFSAYPNFTSDNYKSALKRIYPTVPLDHSSTVDHSRTTSTSTLTSGVVLPLRLPLEDTGERSSMGGVSVVSGGVIDIRSDVIITEQHLQHQQHHLHDSRFDDRVSSRSNSNAVDSVDDSMPQEPARNSFTNATGAGSSHYFPLTNKATLESPARMNRDVSAGSVLSSIELAAKEVELKKLKMELDSMKEKLNKSTRQNDMLRSLCLKYGNNNNNSGNGAAAGGASMSLHSQSADPYMLMDHQRYSSGGTLGSFSDLAGANNIPTRESLSESHQHHGNKAQHGQAQPLPSILFKDQVSKESMEKRRSSFTWASLGFANSSKSSNGGGGVTGGNAGGGAAAHRGSISGHSTTSVVTGGNSLLLSPPANSTLKKSTSVATFNALNGNNNNNYGSSNHHNSSFSSNNRHSFVVNRQSISSRYLSSESSVGLDFNMELSSTSSDLQVKVLDQQDELMACPLKILDMDGPSFTLFVRTYYHKITELELFCNKFDKVFSTLLTHEYTAAPSLEQEEEERAVTDMITSLNTAANCHPGTSATATAPDAPLESPRSTGTSDKAMIKGKLNSNSIVHLYHMIVAIDGVYEFLMTDFEVWRSAMKSWLLRIFTEAIRLPILQPEDLRAVVLCLQKEQLMFENEVIDIIAAAIDTSLTLNIQPIACTTATPAYRESMLGQQGSANNNNNNTPQKMEETFQRTGSRAAITINNNNNSSSGVGASGSKYNFVSLSQYMDNILNTFNHIVGDLIHIIPDEVQVMSIFMNKAQRIIKEELKLSYYTHKNTMLNSELMTIYKFLDTLVKSFAHFGIEKDIVTNLTEFMNDVFKQAHSSTVSFMSVTIGKLITTEEKYLQTFQQRQSYEDLDDYSALTISNSYNQYDRVYTSQWCEDLNAVLKSQLALIPPAVAPTIKVYLSLQLLDSLTEYNDKQLVWLKQLPLKLNAPTIDKLCLFINNQYHFISLMTDTLEAWAYSIEDHYMTKISEKLEQISKLFKEAAINAGEALTKILHADFKDILKNDVKNGLFTKSWENSIKTLTMVKGCLRKNLSGVCYNVNNDIDGCAEMRQSIVYEACCSVVAVYLETLLCCSTFTLSTHNNVTNIGSTTGTSHTQERLMEDVEVLTKLFEELRVSKCSVSGDDDKPIIYTTATASTTQNTAANGGNGDKKQYTRKRTLGATIVGSLFRRTSAGAAAGGGMQRSNSSADLRVSFSADNLSTLSTSGSSNNLTTAATSTPTTTTSASNKQKFTEILKPLSHIVFAGQMDGQDLVDFVKQELYLDFGVVCVRLWQLLMYWKGESQDIVNELFQENFEHWSPRRLQTDPLMSLSYLNNNQIKHVTFLK